MKTRLLKFLSPLIVLKFKSQARRTAALLKTDSNTGVFL